MSPFTNEEIEAIMTLVAAIFGGMTLAYLRHPGTIHKAVISVILSVGLSWIFAPIVAEYTGIYVVPIAGLLGMTGLIIANRIIIFVESLDVGKWVKKP